MVQYALRDNTRNARLSAVDAGKEDGMELSIEHQQVADMARRFADAQIRPQAERLDREEAFAAAKTVCSALPFPKPMAVQGWTCWPIAS